MSLFDVYVRRTNKVIVDSKRPARGADFGLVATLDANLRKLGYALADDLAYALLFMPKSEVASLHDSLVPLLKQAKGVRAYRPMYPNFPAQVMEASAAELYINAILHYFGNVVGLRIMPKYDELARPELNFDESKVTLLRAGSREDALAMVNNILMQTAAFGEAERDDIKSLEFIDLLKAHSLSDEHLPNRENSAWLGNFMASVHGMLSFRCTPNTATDVLRLAVAMNDGDVSLAENTKFRLSRPQRRVLMNALSEVADSSTALAEDMLRHEQMWKRLGEAIHPGEFKDGNLAVAVDAFRQLRNGEAKTFNSKIEGLVAGRDPLGAARALRKRPGDFARRLDALLCLAPTIGVKQEIVRLFGRVAKDASPTVLTQVENHFLNREGKSGPRVFFPKGNVSKMKSIEDTRDSLPWAVTANAAGAASHALMENFSKRPALGRVWIDPAVSGLAVPFGVRSASKALRTVGRGSRLPLGDDTNIVRFFIWWKNGYDRTDIDLSAVVLDDNFNSVFDITYYHLRDNGAVHSGDITSAPNGASEFIDIDIERVKQRGGRYVLMNLFSYSGQDFVELPECFAGFMQRRDFDSGEIYDPRTVTNRLDLSAKSKNACPFIFDLETREAIWVDLTHPLRGNSRGGYNVASNKVALTNTVEALTSLKPVSLHRLMLFHAMARGTLVNDREHADFVFAEDGDFSPYETERVLAELL